MTGTAGGYGSGGSDLDGGGGGGGGLWGGGSGGSGGLYGAEAGSGGGGGGSNLVPAGGTAATATADENPRVVISYQTSPAATVTFTSGPPPAGTVGEPYSFTFTATGDSEITFDITDGTLPPGLTLSSAGVLSGTPSSAGSHQFTVTATGSSGATASQQNTVTISAETPPPSPPPAARADLAVHLSASPNPVKSGRELTYTVVVSNAGPDTARPVRMTDVLPGATQFTTIAPGPGWSCTTPPVGTSGTLTCDALALASGTSSSISFTVRVVSSGKSTVTNTAEVSSEVDDPDAADNIASVTTSVQGRR